MTEHLVKISAMPEYDTGTALWCGVFANLAYDDEAEIRQQLDSLGCTFVKYWDVGGTQAFACIADNVLIIAWRGTTLRELRDLLSDGRIWPTDGPNQSGDRVSKGFDIYTRRIIDDVQRIVERGEENGYPCIQCGHSLGAIAAIHGSGILHVRGAAPDVVYAYAAPLGVNDEYAAYIERHLVVYSHVDGDDAIPRIPFLMGLIGALVPVGHVIYFDRHGIRHLTSSRWLMKRDRLAKFARSSWQWLKSKITDHSMSNNYLRHLWRYQQCERS